MIKLLELREKMLLKEKACSFGARFVITRVNIFRNSSWEFFHCSRNVSGEHVVYSILQPKGGRIKCSQLRSFLSHKKGLTAQKVYFIIAIMLWFLLT